MQLFFNCPFSLIPTSFDKLWPKLGTKYDENSRTQEVLVLNQRFHSFPKWWFFKIRIKILAPKFSVKFFFFRRTERLIEVGDREIKRERETCGSQKERREREIERLCFVLLYMNRLLCISTHHHQVCRRYHYLQRFREFYSNF